MMIEFPLLFRINRVHAFLKNKDEKYFKENQIKRCEECDATGLLYKSFEDSFSWDCTSFCDKCKGMGYIGNVSSTHIGFVVFICRNCEGVGCPVCEDIGVVDWVSHIVGR